MPSIEIGRVCVRTAGRDAGKYCVITKVLDKNFVEITGPKSLSGVAREKSNINHIEVTGDKIESKSDAKDEDVLKAVEKAGLTEKFKAGVRI
ncbi:50S ribosomal protein L14e [uncultured archaeon]|nr:50S ribosomal protein L14e [uncultured archaeon]